MDNIVSDFKGIVKSVAFENQLVFGPSVLTFTSYANWHNFSNYTIIGAVMPIGIIIYAYGWLHTENVLVPQHRAETKVLAMLLREHERAFFTDRSEMLAVLHHNAELICQGKGANLALVGQQRIGKTILAQRFADDLSERHSLLVPVYFDVARNLVVPSVFAIRLLASIGRSFVEADGRRVEESSGVLDAASLLSIADQTQEDTIVAAARQVTREMEKDRPDERLLLETVFSCLEQTAQHTGRKPLVILDEFHNVTQLDSFPRIKDALSVVGQTLSRQTSVR